MRWKRYGTHARRELCFSLRFLVLDREIWTIELRNHKIFLQNLADQLRTDYEQNVSDAVAMLTKLMTGLDVNVKFTGYVYPL